MDVEVARITIAYAVARALAERKFRIVLRRPDSHMHLPGIMRLRLFLADGKDHLDSLKCQAWLIMYKKLESYNQELRTIQLELTSVLSPERELVEYEKKLSFDLERASGGGLVRTLGGPKAARNKLDDIRSQLNSLKESAKNLRGQCENLEVYILQHSSLTLQRLNHLQRQIRWMFEGDHDRYISFQIFGIQFGHGVYPQPPR